MGRRKKNCDGGCNKSSFHKERNLQSTRRYSWKGKNNPKNRCKEPGDCASLLSTRLDSSASTSSSTAGDDTECDLPGFYYDKEKKAYFKILPNTMSTVSSFVTKENIKKKENEEKRQSDVKSFLKGRSSVLQSALFLPNDETSQSFKDLTEVLRQFQCGQVTCENFRSYMNRHCCTILEPSVEVVSSGSHQNSLKHDGIKKMLTTSAHDYLVCVWSLKSSIAQCLQLLSVSGDLRSLKGKGRGAEATETSRVIKSVITAEPIFKKISSLCWASFPNNDVSTHTVLYTATCPIGYSPTIVYAYNFDIVANSMVSIFELNLGFNTVWSSAWHNFDAKFSVGAERKCHLIDVATRRTWTYYTHNSDPLSQTFSSTNPHKMYNGTRGGSIVVHDIRCPGKSRSQQEMRQKHGVSCLKLLRDENYIMANDFSGGIVNWDQRMTRIVRKYEGLVNSHYQLPFHLDEQESILCGAGSDNYSKLWDFRSGTLLQSIPPSCPASQDSFPIAMYAQGWGNCQGNSGLIVAFNNSFKVYC